MPAREARCWTRPRLPAAGEDALVVHGAELVAHLLERLVGGVLELDRGAVGVEVGVAPAHPHVGAMAGAVGSQRHLVPRGLGELLGEGAAARVDALAHLLVRVDLAEADHHGRVGGHRFLPRQLLVSGG